MRKPAPLKVGDTVRLRRDVEGWGPMEGRDDNKTAKIKVFLKDISGGFVTDRDLECCRYWNVAHVQRVAKAKSP